MDLTQEHKFAPDLTERDEELSRNEFEGVMSEEECLHTPDTLEHIGTEESFSEVVQYFKCQCGKTVTERFTSVERIVL